MRLLKLLNSVHFGIYIHLNLFKKPATHAKAYAKMGAPRSNVMLNVLARRSVWQTACDMRVSFVANSLTFHSSTNYCEQSEQIELLNFSDSIKIGDYQNA